MAQDKRWQPLEVIEAEEQSSHRGYGVKMIFYRAVAGGLIDVVQENCSRSAFEDMRGAGHLSDDPVTNLKYHFVVTAAMVARFCVEGGMALEEAFSLSDDYIQKMDRSTDVADIVLLHDRMVLDYAGRMRILKKYAASSRQVADAVDYIYSHIRERITIEELAAGINVSPTYLSRIFKKEMGVSVSEYIRQRKVDLAKNLLRFSDMEMAEIANTLSFSSQSHFIQQFRTQTGMTPKAYRSANYMNNWDVNRE